MKLSKKLAMGFFALVFVVPVMAADKNCVSCGGKMNGLPLNTAMIEKLAESSQSLEVLNDACMEFDQVEQNFVEKFMDKYSQPEFFQRNGCHTQQYTRDQKSPMIQMVIDAPATREGFPKIIYLYYNKRKNDNNLWLKAINSKNDQGETFLDYIETRINSGKISSTETMQAALNIKNFVCSKGGIYSKYSNKKCP